MNTKFKQVIKNKKTTITYLAKYFNVSREHLTNIANGAPAGKNLAKKIETWTGGEISCTDVIYPK